MTVQIVFIRHGIAENSSTGKDDNDRSLTQKGIKKLRDTLPQILPMLESDRTRQIWSSPLARARETSEIAADIFGVERVIIHDFIRDGDFNGFWNTVTELDPLSEHTIIVVGHEPTMGYWAEALCSAYLPFKKGASAGFLYRGKGLDKAELQWFLQPEAMEAFAARANASDTITDIRNALTSLAHQIQTARRMFMEEPSDPEATHQLRVSIRKLRSLLSFFRPYQKDKQNSFLQGQLRDLVSEFSYLRELDVLWEACQRVADSHSGAMASDSLLLGMIKDERTKEAQRVSQYLMTAEKDDSILQYYDTKSGDTNAYYTLTEQLKKLEWKKNIEGNQSIKMQMKKRFAELFRAFERFRESANYYDTAAAHSVRIQGKKMRYVLVCVGSLLEIKSKSMEAELDQVHEELGRLCDARRNKEILLKLGNPDWDEKTSAELRAVIKEQKKIEIDCLRLFFTC